MKKLDAVLVTAIDRMARETAVTLERLRRQGQTEDELRRSLDAAAQQYRELWVGRITDEFLDQILAQLGTGIQRHREAIGKRVN